MFGLGLKITLPRRVNLGKGSKRNTWYHLLQFPGLTGVSLTPLHPQILHHFLELHWAFYFFSADISQFEDEAHSSSCVLTSPPVWVQIWSSPFGSSSLQCSELLGSPVLPLSHAANIHYLVLLFTSCRAIREHQPLTFLTLLNNVCPLLGHPGYLASNSSTLIPIPITCCDYIWLTFHILAIVLFCFLSNCQKIRQ